MPLILINDDDDIGIVVVGVALLVLTTVFIVAVTLNELTHSCEQKLLIN